MNESKCNTCMIKMTICTILLQTAFVHRGTTTVKTTNIIHPLYQLCNSLTVPSNLVLTKVYNDVFLLDGLRSLPFSLVLVSACCDYLKVGNIVQFIDTLQMYYWWSTFTACHIREICEQNLYNEGQIFKFALYYLQILFCSSPVFQSSVS